MEVEAIKVFFHPFDMGTFRNGQNPLLGLPSEDDLGNCLAMFFSNTTIDGGDGAITVVWKYFISMFGQLFVLVTVIKGSDQIIQKMLGI